MLVDCLMAITDYMAPQRCCFGSSISLSIFLYDFADLDEPAHVDRSLVYGDKPSSTPCFATVALVSFQCLSISVKPAPCRPQRPFPYPPPYALPSTVWVL